MTIKPEEQFNQTWERAEFGTPENILWRANSLLNRMNKVTRDLSIMFSEQSAYDYIDGNQVELVAKVAGSFRVRVLIAKALNMNTSGDLTAKEVADYLIARTRPEVVWAHLTSASTNTSHNLMSAHEHESFLKLYAVLTGEDF